MWKEIVMIVILELTQKLKKTNDLETFTNKVIIKMNIRIALFKFIVDYT